MPLTRRKFSYGSRLRGRNDFAGGLLRRAGRSIAVLFTVITVTFGVQASRSAEQPGGDRQPLLRRLHQSFPLAERVFAGSAQAVRPVEVQAQQSAAIRAFARRSYRDAYRIESDRAAVTLRPVNGGAAEAVSEGAGTSYYGAFPGVEALRIDAASHTREIFFIENASARHAIAFEIVFTESMSAIVPDGRGIRFIAAASPRANLALSAPLIIDAAGRPSLSARWELGTTGSVQHIALRIDDESLQFPVVVSYVRGTVQVAAAATAEAMTALSQKKLIPAVNSTGSVSGTVTDSGSGQPLGGVFVLIFDSTGSFVTFGTTDANGNYTVAGLATGTYFALADSGDYTTQLYSGIACPGGICSVTSGNPITVNNGSNTPNINFALTTNQPRVSGHVTDATNTPLTGVTVVFFDSTGTPVASADTSAGGYNVVLPNPGTYFARTFNNVLTGYADQLYNGIDCTGCDVLSGTPISATAGSFTSNINFVLKNGGRIAGTVTDGGTGQPLTFGFVSIYNASGTFVTFGNIDNSGHYVSFNGLATGTYYALASLGGYQPDLYDGIPCPSGCVPTSGTGISVTVGSTHSSVDFVLNSLTARVRGTVVDATNNTPLANVAVDFYTANGTFSTTTNTDIDGTYLVDLPASGTYYARTRAVNYAGIIDQLYDGIDCTACIVTTGTQIHASVSTVVSNINFALNRNGGGISGQVTDAATNAPIAFALVVIYSGAGTVITHGVSDANGNYTTVNGLTTGTYYATAMADGYTDQLYSGVSCANGCTVTNGTQIHVTGGSDTPSINFAMASNSARITGKVFDSSNGNPLQSVPVNVYDSQNALAGSALTDASGNYVALVGASGTYYAIADASAYPTLQSQLYDHIACVGCTPSTGTPITATVGAVTSGIDFPLTTNACSSLDLQPATLADSAVGDAYNQIVTLTNGAAPITYAVTSGALPTGLSLGASTGVITGTPLDAGSFSFFIRGTDNNGCNNGRDYTIVIAPNPPSLLSLNPTSGTTVGGDTVVLNGSALGSATSVTFGGDNAVISNATANTVTVTTPAHAAGAVDVTLFTAGGSATLPQSFTYVAPQVPTTTTLAASATNVTFGTPIMLTANVSPLGATGTVTFRDGNVVIGNGQLVNGSVLLNVSLIAGGHDLTATYEGTSGFLASTSNTIHVDVIKATPVITWNTPAPITYGTPLTAVQLNATANVAGSFSYSPAAGTILDAGNQLLSTTFTPTDTADYNTVSANVTLVVNKANQTIHWPTPPNIVYGTPLDSSILNATVTVVGPAPGGALTYNPPAGMVLNAGTYTLSVDAAATNDYNEATATVILIVLKATPTFTNLSAPTIILGTPTTTISGHISADALVPTGSVTITLNNVNQTASIDTAGNFSSTFSTASLDPVNPGYTVDFAYPGDSNFNAASATSLLIVAYNTKGGTLLPGPKNVGSAVPFKLQVTNSIGMNISSPDLLVVAYGVRLTTSANWVPAQPTGNNSTTFNYQGPVKFGSSTAGSYQFVLKTDGLSAGNWLLGFTIGDDPTIHTVPFTLR